MRKFKPYLPLALLALAAVTMAAGVNGVFNSVNSALGYKVAGGAGTSGYALCSDGTRYNTACSVAGSGITALTGPVTASGSGSVASTITPTGVTAGSYTNANITVNAAGQLTAASNGSLTTTCNLDGCYYQLSDGTYVAWGVSTSVTGTPANQVLSITYPITFTTAPSPTVAPVAAPGGGGGPCTGFSCPVGCNTIRGSLLTTGASVAIFVPQLIGGSGYSGLANGDYCEWTAIGK